MKQSQFFDKHKNLDIERKELERKYQAYLREQEEMGMLEVAARSAASGGSKKNSDGCLYFDVDTTGNPWFYVEVGVNKETRINIDWGDGSLEEVLVDSIIELSHEYPDFSTYSASFCFSDAEALESINFYGND